MGKPAFGICPENKVGDSHRKKGSPPDKMVVIALNAMHDLWVIDDSWR
jgi:hypothetical protein